MRRGLSGVGPSHHSVADAAHPNAANAASSKAAWSSSMSRSSLLNMSAMVSVISRPSFRVRTVALDWALEPPWIKTRITLGCSSTQGDVLFDGAADDLAGRVGGQVDRREDRCPQHVAQPFTDRQEQVGLVGEMPVDLRLGGAGLLGDLPHAQLGPQPVDGAESRVDDFAAHLLAVLTPTLAARVDFHPGLRARVGQRGSRHSHHVKHLTAWEPLTCADRGFCRRRVWISRRDAPRCRRNDHARHGIRACRTRSPRPLFLPAPSAAAGCSTAS